MVSCRRAMILLYKEHAEVVQVSGTRYDSHGFAAWVKRSGGTYSEQLDERERTEDWIFTVTYPVRVPRIIRLLRYDRYTRRKVPMSRRTIFARDNYSCQYCGVRRPTAELTLDHVVPRFLGGRECWENVVTACSKCNHRKGMRSVEESGMRLLHTPRAPEMNPLLEHNLQDHRYESWRTFLS